MTAPTVRRGGFAPLPRLTFALALLAAAPAPARGQDVADIDYEHEQGAAFD